MKIMDVINITSMKNTKVFTKLVFYCGLFESVTTISHYKLCDGCELYFSTSVLAVSAASRAQNQTATSLQGTKNSTGGVKNEHFNHFSKPNAMLKHLRASHLSSAAQIPLSPRQPRYFLPVML